MQMVDAISIVLGGEVKCICSFHYRQAPWLIAGVLCDKIAFPVQIACVCAFISNMKGLFALFAQIISNDIMHKYIEQLPP